MIHKYRLFNTNIVTDVYSGAVHIFDDAAYRVLDYFGMLSPGEIVDKLGSEFTEDQINEAITEITALKDEGLLFTEDTYREFLPLWEKKPVVKALCLHISHDCNLRCRYCFASTGNFGGQRLLMKAETGMKAVDFLIEQSGGRRNLEIDFFGGEPMMNFEAVKKIIEYALSKEEESGKKFKFTLTTNALLLKDEHISYINENIQNIVLSIDGRKETNDRMRYRIDGKGSYDTIMPLIKKVAESRDQTNYYVRGTFTRENLDFSKDVLHLADQGFRQISVEPVVAARDTGYDIREEDLPFVFEEYEKLASEYVVRNKGEGWFNFFHFMIDLSQGPCVAKRLGGCGSGHEYLAVTPEGDLYPCHQFVGMEDFKIGTVFDGIINSNIRDTFKNSNIYTKGKCSDCWAKFYCSGGCAANAYQFNNDINKPYSIGCELEKKRVECALWVKSQE